MEEHNIEQSNLIKEVSIPIYEARTWLKLLGVLNIIGGIMAAVTIVGIVIAWLPIWMGVILYQAGSSSEQSYFNGDKFSFIKTMNQFKLYFTIQGILALIGIIFWGIMLIAFFVGGLAFGEYFDEFKYY